MNTELGRKVLEHVTAHRGQFDMSIYVDADPECGTTACLAGWAMLLSGYRAADASVMRPDGSYVIDKSNEAARLLGLDHAEQYGSYGDCTLFGEFSEERAIERFRAILEAAEARQAAWLTEG
jgi:hypothetical protein